MGKPSQREYAAKLLRQRQQRPAMGCLAQLLYAPIALALLAAAGWWLWRMAPQLPRLLKQAPLPLQVGAVAFVAGLVLFSFLRLSPVYVLGHELTHWLVAKLFRRKTGALRLGWDSGSVAVENPNAAIILAPYCLPLYFLLSLGVAAFCAQWFPEARDPRYQTGIGAWLGLCYAYHLILTANTMRTSQSDFRYCGWPLSMLFIIGCNLLVLDLLFFVLLNAIG